MARRSSSSRKSIFSKGLVGRLGAVGLFVALGTFAVIQSIHGPNPDESAEAESGEEELEPNSANPIDVSNANAPKPKNDSSSSGQPLTAKSTTSQDILFGGVPTGQKTAAQKPSISGSIVSKTGTEKIPGIPDTNSNSQPKSNFKSTATLSANNNNKPAQKSGSSNTLTKPDSTFGGTTKSSFAGITQKNPAGQTQAKSSFSGSGPTMTKPASAFPGSSNANTGIAKSANPSNPIPSKTGIPTNPNDSRSIASSQTNPAATNSFGSPNSTSQGSLSSAPKLLSKPDSSGFNPSASTNQQANGQSSGTASRPSSLPPFGNAKTSGDLAAVGQGSRAGNTSSSFSNNTNANRDSMRNGNTFKNQNPSNDRSLTGSNINNRSTTLANSSTSSIPSSFPTTGSANASGSGSLRPDQGKMGSRISPATNPGTGFAPMPANRSGLQTNQNGNVAGNSTSQSAIGVNRNRSSFSNSLTNQGSFSGQSTGQQNSIRPTNPHDSLDQRKALGGTSSSGFNSSLTGRGTIDQKQARSTQSNSPPSSKSGPMFGNDTNSFASHRSTSGAAISASSASSITSVQPGDRQYEGIQTASLTLEKIAPREIQVGRPAKFELVVKNVGRAPAQHVMIHDRIPQGTRLQQAIPDAQQGNDGQLAWSMGTLKPGEHKTIELTLIPMQRGEIGSVATFSFAASASVRTRSTKPELFISHQAPERVLIGDRITLNVKVENRGDGAADNVTIQEEVPEGFEFQGGIRDLEYEVGRLEPNQSRTIKLDLVARKIGKYRNTMVVFGDGPLKSQDAINIEVIAPQLQVAGSGPKRRYLNRPATHQFRVQNNGTAAATRVELVARLPRGLKYLSADKQGRYDSRSHTVFWSMESLPASTQGVVQLETQPIETGSQTINFEVAADRKQSQKTEQTIEVQQLAELFFDIDDTEDVIELGTETSYRVRVVNQGSKIATNIRTVVEFPQAMTPTGVDGGIGNEIRGQLVTLPVIDKLMPGEQKSIMIKARGAQVGDHRVVIKVQSADRAVAESKEVSTKVYSDQ